VVGSVPTLRGELPEEAATESLTLTAASGDSR
jgi:hypothetical protein